VFNEHFDHLPPGCDGAPCRGRLERESLFLNQRQVSLVFEIRKIRTFLWEISKHGAMLVPGRIYANPRMVDHLRDDPALQQVANVACLPGIVAYSLAMPDIHWGYGFPIGGVAAMDADSGVISPGGVGYDINCGVRLARTNLRFSEITPKIGRLADALFDAIPAGVGSQGAVPDLPIEELKRLVRGGANWAVKNGYAEPEDLEHTEEGGCLPNAEPESISALAYKRGSKQLGTLGSRNHFLELSRVDLIYDRIAAKSFGLEPGRVTVLIHSGSRGLGHQTCDDYLRVVDAAMAKYEIRLPDRQVAAVLILSVEGKTYLGAMAAAANFAWCNRQIIMCLARDTLIAALGISPNELGFSLIYDVCHNIAKFEEHSVDGDQRRLRASQRSHARLCSGSSYAADGVARAGPTGNHPRGYGTLFLRDARLGNRDARDIRFIVSWCGSRDEPRQGDAPSARSRS